MLIRSGIFAVILILPIGACGLPAMLEGQQVTFTGSINKPVQEVADCAYLEYEKVLGQSQRKVDLPSKGQSYIEQVANGIRFWKTTFTATSASKTLVQVESFKPPLNDGITGGFDEARIAPLRACGVT